MKQILVLNKVKTPPRTYRVVYQYILRGEAVSLVISALRYTPPFLFDTNGNTPHRIETYKHFRETHIYQSACTKTHTNKHNLRIHVHPVQTAIDAKLSAGVRDNMLHDTVLTTATKTVRYSTVLYTAAAAAYHGEENSTTTENKKKQTKGKAAA